MKPLNKTTHRKGFVILEALLSIVVLSMVVLSVVPMLSYLLKRTARSRYEPQAALLLQEAVEISYNIFVSDWDAYPVDGTYHPGKSGSGKWMLFTGTQNNLETLYTRAIEVKRACRDNDGKLIEGPVCTGTKDNDSRVITAKVTWEDEGETKDLTAKILLVDLEGN